MEGKLPTTWEEAGITVPAHGKGQVKVYCPKCHSTRNNKTDKSLSVHLEEKVWKCHYPNCDFAGKLYDKDFLLDRKKRTYSIPAEPPPNLSEKSLKWLKDRGLSENTIRRFKITDGKEWMPQTEKEQNCIRFPYYRKEQLVNIKYRDGAKNFKMAKDAELIFFHLDSIDGVDDCVITEGEIDCMSVYEAGIFTVVSVPNGASKPKKGEAKASPKLEYLDNCVEYFATMKRIVIATDGDSAGITLRDELARRLGRHRCFYVVYPEGVKDLNEVLMKSGKEEVKALVAAAQAFPIEGVHRVEDFELELDQLYEQGGEERGNVIGYTEFDRLFSFKRGEFTVLTGIPNNGKSSFLNQCLIRLSSRFGWKHAFCSFENQPAVRHAGKLMSCFLGKRIGPGTISPTLWSWGKYFLNEHFYFFSTNDIDLTIDALLDKGKELVFRYGIDSLVIDPWNYVEFNLSPGETETLFISKALSKISKFVQGYDVHVVLVAHPRKMENKSGGFEVPNMYSISGSQHFFSKPDNGITVHIDETTRHTVVYIQKVRHQPSTGEKGNAIFRYEVGTGRYAELECSYSDELPIYLQRIGHELTDIAIEPVNGQ